MVDMIKKINDVIDKELIGFDKGFKEVLEKIKLGAVNLSYQDSYLELQKELNDLLESSGYYDLINNFINKSYDKNYQNIKKLFDVGGLTLGWGANDEDIFKAFKLIDRKFWEIEGSSFANTINKNLMIYGITDMIKEDMAKNLIENMKDTSLVKYANTYAETAISSYNQNIMDEKAKDLEAVYIYTGVLDKKTRKFCRCVLEQKSYYDKSDKDVIKNDKKRKWNCRHIIMPVSVEYAEKNGYTKGVPKC